MEFNATFITLVLLLVVVPSLLGGFVAVLKKDYFSRGLIISLLSSWYGPLFMFFSPPSRAREGNDEDQEAWPINGPLANMCLIGTGILGFILWKYVF